MDCRTHSLPEQPLNVSGFRLASDSFPALLPAPCDQLSRAFNLAPWAPSAARVRPRACRYSIAGALEQLVAGLEELRKLSKNECVSTPPAGEVNKIIATISRLFSIECSSSTGTCQDFVQLQSCMFHACEWKPRFSRSTANAAPWQSCRTSSTRMCEFAKNIVWRGDSRFTLFHYRFTRRR